MKLAIAQQMIRDAYRVAVVLLAITSILAFSLLIALIFIFLGSEDLRETCNLTALYDGTLFQQFFYAIDLH